eukprot:1300968-Prymnesium_polylepis.1
MSRTECARQGAEAIGANTQRREGSPVFRTIRSVPFTGTCYHVYQSASVRVPDHKSREVNMLDGHMTG